ncbi:N-terminal domain of NEFA-interacting nuclear protein NIP30-domain-containing protein [Mycotypha africana]|uniref:N-terminal domain of NEFA-interacting nuclear protein NIP30-domain-containing protein n=1 Tax=Mycotypha africana TaxID=64632 RepID=UPI002301BB9E|nr:N-terminal domain of NEFA-interacting nuclear protein NIP30-domain-containing protein [Mycotypha africana]KAI8991332.1 N-terminal domain of NEFA-interacting nuclear protein NIP30-domain-containing protein [Mycotypha africana]
MSLNFVTGAIVENDEEKQLKTNSTKSEVVQEEYDPRTLYERLQEQKLLKEEKFAEESRFANHIKRIDEDEAEYFKILAEEKEKIESQRKLKEQLELEEFRQAQNSIMVPAQAILPATVAATHINDKGKAAKSSLKAATVKKSTLTKAGAVIMKKRKQEDDSEGCSPRKNSYEGKQNETDGLPLKKKSKTEVTTSPKEDKRSTEAVKKITPAGSLSLLAAYDDGSSSSSESE